MEMFVKKLKSESAEAKRRFEKEAGILNTDAEFDFTSFVDVLL